MSEDIDPPIETPEEPEPVPEPPAAAPPESQPGQDPSATAPAGPWHAGEELTKGVADDGDAIENTDPPPTRAEWRQLATEIRRLAAQIAHGRA